HAGTRGLGSLHGAGSCGVQRAVPPADQRFSRREPRRRNEGERRIGPAGRAGRASLRATWAGDRPRPTAFSSTCGSVAEELVARVLVAGVKPLFRDLAVLDVPHVDTLVV